MSSEQNKVDLSIVVPVKNEAQLIASFIESVTNQCLSMDVTFELLIVNDGSTDDTLAELLLLQTQFPNLVIINLSRNFGKEIALTAGLDYCSGKAVIPMDADFQDPPELIPDLFKQLHQGFDVVLARRSDRRSDAVSKRFFAKVFHWVFKKISETEIEADAGDYRILTERVVQVIRNMPERTRFMKGILSWPGFKTSEVFYQRPVRAKGNSKLRFSHLVKVGLDGLFSFSTAPLRFWTYLGIVLALSSILYMLFTIVKTIVWGIDVPGYASLLTFVLLIGGVNLIGIGILGEYVGRIFLEVKNRPLYVVESVLKSNSKSKNQNTYSANDG